MMTLRTVLQSTYLAAAFIAAMPIPDAVAHAHLRWATPAVDATVDAAAELTLAFNEPLKLAGSSVRLTGPGQTEVKVGAAIADASSAAIVHVPIAAVLKPGAYFVDWLALTGDGHTVAGRYAFTVK
jgi:methionine-rich copper-binding protein CopC